MALGVIPVIDLFAGPGGLGEGFSAHRSRKKRAFRIALSIEKDIDAHATLLLRSFYRQFRRRVPKAYYQHLRGELKRDELFAKFPRQQLAAANEAWRAELGNEKEYPASMIDSRIEQALKGAKQWVLIGGPPCQPYSLVARARLTNQPKRLEDDQRSELYSHYLRVIARHGPPVFVMENVKGMLSASVKGEALFSRLLRDLSCPGESLSGRLAGGGGDARYRLYSFVRRSRPRQNDLHTLPRPSSFIIRAEDFGIPQTRHRVIVLGIREDVSMEPGMLEGTGDPPGCWEAISDLPPIRSMLSREADSAEQWVEAIRRLRKVLPGVSGQTERLRKVLSIELDRLDGGLDEGAEYIAWGRQPVWQADWFRDARLAGVCNHSARAHMASDLRRYFFCICFAQENGFSPKLADLPAVLRPDHKNVNGDAKEWVFKDRFRVQICETPAMTVTCHLAKDGHYFIHPDPSQCRSMTVREVARLQTFPDNYLFCGTRTAQYRQVGNAVPPLLALQLAEVVHGVLSSRPSRSPLSHGSHFQRA